MDKCMINKPCEALTCLSIGNRAPDFCTDAYYRGQEIEVCLDDYRGQWLLLFFYSSDFTFV